MGRNITFVAKLQRVYIISREEKAKVSTSLKKGRDVAILFFSPRQNHELRNVFQFVKSKNLGNDARSVFG